MVEKKHFDGKVLIIGYGAVSRCALPLFLKHIDAPIENITVIDQEDKGKEIESTKTGVRFRQRKVDQDTLENILEEFAGNKGLVVDLATNIETKKFLQWCHDHDTEYFNTSVEVNNPYDVTNILEKTLYYRQMRIRELTEKWPSDSVTACLDHGANPGLISHFTKKGLIDIAERLLYTGVLKGEQKEKVEHYKDSRDFAHLAYSLGVKVIHCSERDTQIASGRKTKKVGEFVNTWSVEGFMEEGVAPVEMGWGTHEKTLPRNALEHLEGPKNQIVLPEMGINRWHRSYVPGVGEIRGMIVRHGEAFGISDRLTVKDENENVIYRPTVHYVYMPSNDTLASLEEFRASGYKRPARWRIMENEITSGDDKVGALIGGYSNNSCWWCGSILNKREATQLAPGRNATTLQVAAGIVSVVLWGIDNPRKGVCLPDDIPHDYILPIAKPYLGELRSKSCNWTPLKERKVFYPENPSHKIDTSDPWQFECFIPLP